MILFRKQSELFHYLDYFKQNLSKTSVVVILNIITWLEMQK